MPDFIVGSVAVTVVPEVRQFAKKLTDDLVPIANTVGKEVGKILGENIRDGIIKGVLDGGSAAIKSAPGIGAAIGKGIKEGINTELKNFHPEIEFSSNLGKISAELDALKMKNLSVNVAANIDTNVSENIAKVKAMEAALPDAKIGVTFRDPITGRFMKSVDIKFNGDTKGAAAELARMKTIVQNSGIADMMDMDVPLPKVRAQLVLLKKLINQAGLSDFLAIDVDKASITKDLLQISNIVTEIPIKVNLVDSTVDMAKTMLDILTQDRVVNIRTVVTGDTTSAIDNPIIRAMKSIRMDISNPGSGTGAQAPGGFANPNLADSIIDFNDSAALAKMAALRLQWHELSKEMAQGIREPFRFDFVSAKIDEIIAKMKVLREANTSATNAMIAEAITMNKAFDIKAKSPASQFVKMYAQANTLGATVNLTPKIKDDKLAALKLKMEAWAKTNGVEVSIKPKIDGNALAVMGAVIQRWAAGGKGASGGGLGAVLLGGAMGIGRGGIGGRGGGFGIGGVRGFAAGMSLPLFAGVLGSNAIGHVNALSLAAHILTDVLIVGLPAIAAASLGLVAFGAAAYDTALKIKTQVQAIDITQSALRQSIPLMSNVTAANNAAFSSATKNAANLTTGLGQLTNAARPQVFELLGGAINALGGKTGVIRNLSSTTGKYLDNLMAKVDLFANKGSGGLNAFLKTGAADMQGFAKVGNSVASVFGSILSAGMKTQVSEKLLGALGNVLHYVADVFKSPWAQWILPFIISIMAVVHYGGIAVTALGGMIGGMANFTKSLLNLSGMQWGAAGLLLFAVAVANVVYELGQADQATKNWIINQNKMINAMPGGNALLQMPTNLGVATAMKNTYAVANKTAPSNYLAQISDPTVGMLTRIERIAGFNLNTTNNDWKSYVAQQAQVTKETIALGQAEGYVQRQGFGFKMSLGILNAAGVTASDTFAQMRQKIDNLLIGYNAMGQHAGTIGADMNAITVAGSDQLKTMGQLNTAWDTFTSLVSAPTDKFLAWYSALQSFGTAAGVAGASMQGIGGGPAVKFTTPKISTASIALQQQFQSVFSASQQMFDAMRNSNALGSTSSFNQVVKDTVANLIPLAGGNKAAAAEISALAQEAGGPATTNLQSLSQWAGNQGAAGAAADLYKQQQLAVTSTYNLSQDAQRLGDTLQKDLVPNMATAVGKAAGVPQAMQAMADSFTSGGAQITKSMTTTVGGMFTALLKQGATPTNAKAIIDGWIQQMDPHLSAAQIKTFWNGLSPASSSAVDALHATQTLFNRQRGEIGKPISIPVSTAGRDAQTRALMAGHFFGKKTLDLVVTTAKNNPAFAIGAMFIGTKIIKMGLNLVGPLWSKFLGLFGGGAIEVTASAQMEAAANTQMAASLNMLRAAGLTETAATEEGAAASAMGVDAAGMGAAGATMGTKFMGIVGPALVAYLAFLEIKALQITLPQRAKDLVTTPASGTPGMYAGVTGNGTASARAQAQSNVDQLGFNLGTDITGGAGNFAPNGQPSALSSFIKDAPGYIAASLNVGNSANTVHSQFMKMLEFYHISSPVAQAYWDQFTKQGGKAGTVAGTTKGQVVNLGNSIVQSLIPRVDTSADSFFNWSGQALISSDKAHKLWSVLGRNNFDILSGKASGNRTEFEKWAAQVGISKGGADDLWTHLRKNQWLDALSGKTKISKQNFFDLASQFDVTGGHAQTLWDKLNKAPNVKATVTVTASALGTINAIAAAIGKQKHLLAQLSFASGGRVPGYGGGDIFPAMVEPGEAIIDKVTTRRNAGTLSRWGVPGFKNGGLVGDASFDAVGSGIDTGRNVIGNTTAGFSGMGVKAFQDAAYNAVVAASVATMGGIGSASGQVLLAAAEKYAGHRYVWGGAANPVQGFDCSSFVGMILGQAGYTLPGGVAWNPNVHGPVASQYNNEPGFTLVGHNVNAIQAGDLLVENSGGHVGWGVGPNRMFSAYGTASGTIFSNAANMTNIYRRGSSVAAASPPGFLKTGNSLVDQIASVAQPIIAASSALATLFPNPSGGAFGGNPGGAFTGSIGPVSQTVARYLMSQGASKAGAAGVAATIFGESGTAGPEAVGSGGFGLIGWTGNTIGLPAGYNQSSLGNVANDWAAQLPGIIGYANARPGGWGPFTTATDPVAAGNLWSAYEAPLVPLSDTRPSLAQQLFAAGYAGGTSGASPGWGWVGEHGKELVHFHGGEQVIPNGESLRIGSSIGRGFAKGTAHPGDWTKQILAWEVTEHLEFAKLAADKIALSKLEKQIPASVTKSIATAEGVIKREESRIAKLEKDKPKNWRHSVAITEGVISKEKARIAKLTAGEPVKIRKAIAAATVKEAAALIKIASLKRDINKDRTLIDEWQDRFDIGTGASAPSGKWIGSGADRGDWLSAGGIFGRQLPQPSSRNEQSQTQLLSRIAAASESAPARTGQHVSAALNGTAGAASVRSIYNTQVGY